jgi:DNA-binding NarL/FixJ family response regulator
VIDAEPDMEVSATAEGLSAALSLPPTTPADIVLVTSDLPDKVTTDGVRRIVRRFPHARVVIMGSDDAPDTAIAALRAGADGYLPRTISPDGLTRALASLARGEAALPRALTQPLVEALRATTPGPVDVARARQLSPRERQVLTELARGRFNAEIAALLGLSETTVKTHVSNVLRKTGVRSRFNLQV